MPYRLSSQYFCESCRIDTQSHHNHQKLILDCLKWIGANLHVNPWWNGDVTNQRILKCTIFQGFSSQKSSFLIEIQTIFNPECFESNLRCLIRFIKDFILLTVVLKWSRNSRTFVAWVQKFCFFNMVRCAEIIISHRNSNHFQSWVSLESSKMYDSIYQNFYFVVRAFESIEKFKKVYSLGAKIAFFVLICHTEIMISHWISHHFQSWMYLM